jgi:hypothetical protein
VFGIQLAEYWLLTTDSVTLSVTITGRSFDTLYTNLKILKRCTVKKTFATIHKILSSLIGIAVFVQMFLAGLWHAEVVSTPEAHIFFGLGILLASLLALIAALVGRMGRSVILPTLILFVLILLQPILIEQRRAGIPLLSAFHTLNAAFIGMTSGIVAVRSKAPEAVETTIRKTAPAPAGD